MIASGVTRRSPAENRQEALSLWGANFWLVLFREREQRRVRIGLGVLGTGFALQLVGYVVPFGSAWTAVALVSAAAVIALTVLGIETVADRLTPLRFHESFTLPDEIRDQRHALRLHTVEEIETWWRLYAERMLDHPVTATSDRAAAEINRGSWHVACPHCGPHHITTAWPQHNLAFCTTCGQTFRVDFPEKWNEIEAVLRGRPEPNRTWKPGQTLDDLRST